MTLLLSLFGCGSLSLEAVDWRIDRTLIAAIRVSPRAEVGLVPRSIDALILSPWTVRSVSVDLCGFRSDQAVEFDGGEASCFSEPSLVDPIAQHLPAEWTPPLATFACPVGDTGQPAKVPGTDVDTGSLGGLVSGWNTCVGESLLRVTAETDRDRSEAAIVVDLLPEARPDWPTFEAADADVRLDVVAGTPEAGAEIQLELSVDPAFAPHQLERAVVSWYVDDGQLEGSGRTRVTSFGDRTRFRNWLQVPRSYHGPLRVAATLNANPPVWAVQTLEIP